jgi:cystinosin
MGNTVTRQGDAEALLEGSSKPELTLPQRIYAFCFGTEKATSISIFACVIITGVILGFSVPDNDPTYPQPGRTFSSVIGWTYFMAWSISFYPQVFVNYNRKTVAGLSFEYQALNLLGFSCYTAYNAGYYWNSEIRTEYAAANDGSMPAVRANDVFFAIHAVLLTAVVLFQIAIYPKGGQRLHPFIIASLTAMVISIIIVLVCVTQSVTSWCTWLNFLLFLSYIKLVITLMKYTPQAYLNYKRKSTHGWTYVCLHSYILYSHHNISHDCCCILCHTCYLLHHMTHFVSHVVVCRIHNVLLDFTGGFLSVVQLFLDCGVNGDWSGAIGDPVKFGLGFTSMVFDIVFMTQHYILYKDAVDEDAAVVTDGDETPALDALSTIQQKV